MLRWYPEQWRRRYGDEFTALLEESLDGRAPSLRFRISVAWAALREHFHASGLVGPGKPAADRIRGGALAVLGAWGAFVIAGAGFAKNSEHFAGQIPGSSRAAAVDAYDAIQAVAAVAALLVVIGALITLPPFFRLLRAGEWPSVRRHFRRAGWASVTAAAALASLVPFANTLTTSQRNGGFWPYTLAFAFVAILVIVVLTLWVVAAIATTLRLTFSRTALTVEAALASSVAVAMALLTAGTAAWWGVVAFSAPWVLQGSRTGSAASVFEPQLAATMTLMLAATLISSCAVIRIARSWRDWRLA
jgi:hypothetical protein